MLTVTERAAACFRALSDPTRLAVATLLTQGDYCVMDVANRLGLSHQAASHHLRQLQIAGLADRRRDGKQIHYGLHSFAVQLIQSCYKLLDEKMNNKYL